jgi:hypothetical protein
MTGGHLRARVKVVDDPNRSRNAQLIFDYRDVHNYKLAGLRVGAQKWVIKTVRVPWTRGSDQRITGGRGARPLA